MTARTHWCAAMFTMLLLAAGASIASAQNADKPVGNLRLAIDSSGTPMKPVSEPPEKEYKLDAGPTELPLPNDPQRLALVTPWENAQIIVPIGQSSQLMWVRAQVNGGLKTSDELPIEKVVIEVTDLTTTLPFAPQKKQAMFTQLFPGTHTKSS